MDFDRKIDIEDFRERLNDNSLDFEELRIDLIALKDKELLKKQAIESDLELAKIEKIETGKFKDLDWYRRAHFAAKSAGRESQKYQYFLNLVNEKIKKGRRLNHDRLFVVAAKIVLDKDTFAKIVSVSDTLNVN